MKTSVGTLDNVKIASVTNLVNTISTIRGCLVWVAFVDQNGDIAQKDMKKANKLPSIPCVLNYYPELKNFTDIKRVLCNLTPRIRWTKENALK